MTDFNIPPKIIYIAGTGRNGSTFIGNILAEIPDVVSVGELRYLWRDLYFQHLCGCGKEINSCEFWREVIRESFGSLSKNDLKSLMLSTERLTSRFGIFDQKLHNQNSHNSKLTELTNACQSVYKAIQIVSRRNIIVDSSKTPLFHRFLISRLSFPIYTIHLVRDPRASSYSWITKKANPDPTEPFLPQFSVLSTAFSWITWNLIIEAQRNKNYLRMLYENWVDKPQTSLEKIMQFVDIMPPSNPLIQGKKIEIGVHHTVSGNPVRFNKGALEIKLDERWKQSMPLYQKILVLAQTWPLYLRYYYFDKNL